MKLLYSPLNLTKDVVFDVVKPKVIAEDSPTIIVHAAKAVEQKGYWKKRGLTDEEIKENDLGPVVLNEEIFKSFVKNFYAKKDPLPCYYEHEDFEARPSGAPLLSKGYILATKETETDFFTLIELTQECWNYIKQGMYKFASIAFADNDIDMETAKETGPIMYSLAFTNSPAIDGLQPITFSKRKKVEIDAIYFSEESMKKKVTLTDGATVDKAEDVQDKMTAGKTMDVVDATSFAKWLDDLHKSDHSDMDDKTFFEAVKSFVEEGFSDPDEGEEIAGDADKTDDVAAAMSSFAESEKALKEQIMALSAELETLKKSDAISKEKALTARLDNAISRGIILSVQRKAFEQMAKTSPVVFSQHLDNLEEDAKKNPALAAIVLSQMSKPDLAQDSPKQPVVSPKEELDDRAIAFLSGAGIKVSQRNN